MPWRQRGEIQLHEFLNFTPDGGNCSTSCPGCFISRRKGPWYPLDWRLIPELVWMLWRREISYSCYELNPSSSMIQPIAQLLHQLSCEQISLSIFLCNELNLKNGDISQLLTKENLILLHHVIWAEKSLYLSWTQAWTILANHIKQYCAKRM
jgi:hypothetical protein